MTRGTIDLFQPNRFSFYENRDSDNRGTEPNAMELLLRRTFLCLIPLLMIFTLYDDTSLPRKYLTANATGTDRAR